MFELFYRGGPLFMGILSFLLLLIIVVAIFNIIRIFNKDNPSASSLRENLSYIKSIGLFAMITGILGQLIGLYSAFNAIEAAGDVSPALLYGGLKVSMITTLYGILIYLFSILVWLVLSTFYDRKTSLT